MADEPLPAPDPAGLAKLEVQAAMYKAQFSEAADHLEASLNELFKHVENMAAHIVALEAVVSAVLRTHSVDAAAVEEDVRNRIAAGTGSAGDPTQALLVARRLMDKQEA